MFFVLASRLRMSVGGEYSALVLLLPIVAIASALGIGVYARFSRQTRPVATTGVERRLIWLPAVVWILAYLALWTMAYRLGLAYEINQLLWRLTGPPDDLYGLRNLLLPRIFAQLIIATPPWWIAIVLFRWFHHRLQQDHARCGCGYDLTGNVSGKCPECGSAAESLLTDAYDLER